MTVRRGSRGHLLTQRKATREGLPKSQRCNDFLRMGTATPNFFKNLTQMCWRQSSIHMRFRSRPRERQALGNG